MYKVMLIDDDYMVLEFLRQMIPWEPAGFTMIGAYTNAVDALEKVKEEVPDLLVTDIGLPGMTGIEFIQRINQLNSQVSCVILSCHDDFQYAQQAVQLGVYDYILKETLSREGFMDLLGKIRLKLDDQSQLKEKYERMNYLAKVNQSVMKDKWLHDLLSNPTLDDRDWIRTMGEYGLDTASGNYIPVIYYLHRFEESISRFDNEEILLFTIDNVAEELLQDRADVLYFNYSANRYVMLFACPSSLKISSYDVAVQTSRSLQHAFEKYLHLQMSVIIGEMKSSPTEVKSKIRDLLQQVDQIFYETSPEIFKEGHRKREFNDDDIFRYYSEYADHFNRLIIEGNTEIEPMVSQYIDFISEVRFHPSSVKHFVLKLVLDIQMKLKFNQQYMIEKVQRQLDELVNVSELKEWMIQFLEKAVIQMDQIARQSKKIEIIDARKYVQLHLDRKISLEEVAAYLHLNSSYFSRLFKKETGENFIEYVTRMKMEKAKELLSDPNKTIEAIAQQLGYENKGYFVKLFKTHFGVIPSQFSY
ncbi:MAG: hypothetical protein JWN30_1374 [Bacilli bacterium]|nr:hypothetical protein [Bacilli bacterium]